MNPRAAFALGAAVLLVALAAPSSAQTTLYLSPSSYSSDVGDSLQVRQTRGDALAPQASAWAADQTLWFFVRTSATQENHDEPPTTDNAFETTLDRPGVTLVGLDRKARIETIEVADLRDFTQSRVAPAAREALERAAGVRAADGTLRVRRVEAAKALVRVRSDVIRTGASAIATSKTGQETEIRALMDPTATPPGGDLAVRLYLNGEKLAGARVTATSVVASQSQTATSDPQGIANVRITNPGIWRVEFHHLAAADDKDADLVLYSGTLTFEVPEGGAE